MYFGNTRDDDYGYREKNVLTFEEIPRSGIELIGFHLREAVALIDSRLREIVEISLINIFLRFMLRDNRLYKEIQKETKT